MLGDGTFKIMRTFKKTFFEMKGAVIDAALRFLTPLVGLHCVWVRGEGADKCSEPPLLFPCSFASRAVHSGGAGGGGAVAPTIVFD